MSTLRRDLGLVGLIAFGVGDILGAGIYALVGKVAGVAGYWTWLAFLGALAVAGVTALAYAELSGRFPRSAGEAHYCQLAFRRSSLSVLVGWMVFASGLVSLATVSRAFAGYLLPGRPHQHAIAIAALLLGIAAINFSGMRQSSAMNLICTVVEASGLLLVLVVGWRYLGELAPASAAASTDQPVPLLLIAQGSALAFFAFIGFEDMVNVAEEVKNPERHLPLAILLSLALAGGLYILIARIATSVLPPEVLAASDAPLVDVVAEAAPQVPSRLFSLIALFAVANTGLLNFIMGSRLLYGMARQRLIPALFGVVHARTRTPHYAILAMLIMASLLAFSATLVSLAGATSLLLLLVFLVVNLSLLGVRRRQGPPTSGFRIPALVAAVGALSCFTLIFFVPIESVIVAGVVILLGLVLAGSMRLVRRREQQGSL